MTDLWRYQCKGAGCHACFKDEGVIGGATCPYCGNIGRRIILMPTLRDDKADGRPDMHVSTGPDDLGFDGKPVIR